MSSAAVSAGRLSAARRTLDGLLQDGRRTLLMGGALAVVGWLVLYPLFILFRMGLRAPDGSFTLQNYVDVFTEPGLSGALLNSVVIGAATTGVSLLLALPMAWGVARTRMPLKGFVTACVTVAFVIPNFIGAIAWILLLGKNAGWLNVLFRGWVGAPLFDIYSVTGLILVLSLSFFPMIYFAVLAALQSMSPIYEEAAQMSGAPAWRGSIGITLPLVLPAIASSSVLVFLEAVGAFGAPAAVATGGNFHTLTTKLYDMFTFPPGSSWLRPRPRPSSR